MKLNCTVIFCVLLLATASLGQQGDPSVTSPCWMLITADLSDPKAPAFKDYPAAVELKMPRVKLDLTSSPVARMYRTLLREEMIKGPNYAGHYRMAIYGCGSDCEGFAVVNLRTGRVTAPPAGASYVSDGHLDANDFLSDAKSHDNGGVRGSGFRYRTDSRLLVLLWELGEDARQGTFYFVLKKERLVLVHSTKKRCENGVDRKSK